MMNILLYAVAGIVLLGIAAYAAGSAIPESHTATVTEEYAAPPEKLWTIITDPAKFMEWRSGLSKVEFHDGLVTEHSSHGAMSYRFVDASPPNRVTTAMTNGKELGFEGNWTFQLQPTAAGTRLTITERGRVFHPLFRLMARYFFSHEKTMQTYHADLRKRLSGQ
jgi:uncharacterized protein YndB with AHSA1/START domain